MLPAGSVVLTHKLIETVLATIPNRTIGLVGDLFLDRYLDIDPARDEPSVETGLTAYQVTRVRSYPGALGTVLNNLAALGVGRIYPISIVGDDGEGYELRQALSRLPGVETSGLVVSPHRRTPTYTKPMYGDRELNRLDIKNHTPTPAELETEVLGLIEEAFPQFDAVLIVDQVSEANCGVVTNRVRSALAEYGEHHPTFLLADSRANIFKFRSVCIKPNFAECYPKGMGPAPGDDLEIGGFVAQKTCGRTVFCTAGEDGIWLYEPDNRRRHLPAFPVTGPTDTCGAGDSCSAGIAAAVVSGASHAEAAAFGNLVASITVQQIGVTGTARPQQVWDRWRDLTRLAGPR